MSQTDTFSPLERMIQQQIYNRGIQDERILNALRTVRREKFFPAEIQEEAYADRAAAIGFGQTISQPYMVALMTAKLEVQPSHRVLEIGTGSGYQTAILAHLAGEVFSIERVKPLLDEAWERVMEMGIRNVHFRHSDGTIGWVEAGPFDRVLITAGAPAIPRGLLMGQLKEEGIVVLPVGPSEEQMLLRVRRRGNELEAEEICPCRFVKLVGREGWEVES